MMYFRIIKLKLSQMMRLNIRLRDCTALAVTFAFVYFSGLTLYLREEDYHSEFTYPLQVNILKLISQLRANRKPELEPKFQFKEAYLLDSRGRCLNELGKPLSVRLLYIIKSKYDHFTNRQVIRETWGRENRFSDVLVRRIFLLGNPQIHDSHLQQQINNEESKFHDLIQSNFTDTYYNNINKTIMGINWVFKHCPTAEFIFFADDDYYISTKNVLRYLRKPNFYPNHLVRPFLDVEVESKTLKTKPMAEKLQGKVKIKHKGGDEDQDEDLRRLSESPMYVGFVFPSSKPHRIAVSKWTINLQEYPYSRYPPYVTAGAYILSKESLIMFYYTSLYTKPFRFDDIYVGILAKKCFVEPVHNPYFYFYELPYRKTNYEFVIASHGYEDTKKLMQTWNEQYVMGNA
ncbi:hypothetical protein CHUAL_014015 [Chamberlinius hualienensis]